MPYANGAGQGFSNSSLVVVFHLAKIEGPLPLRKAEGVLQERLSAGLPSSIYLWWLMSRSAAVLCIRGADAGQRRSPALAALCPKFTMEGKVHSVHGPLTTLSGCRK